MIGTATGAVFFIDGKQATTDNAFDKLKGGAVWSIARSSGRLHAYDAGTGREILNTDLGGAGLVRGSRLSPLF